MSGCGAPKTALSTCCSGGGSAIGGGGNILGRLAVGWLWRHSNAPAPTPVPTAAPSGRTPRPWTAGCQCGSLPFLLRMLGVLELGFGSWV